MRFILAFSYNLITLPKNQRTVSAYNAEKTILETIDSIRKQTFEDFEIIVIDDGSKDKTLEIVESIADERIKLFSYPNGGLPIARNRGIEHSLGDFLSFIDSDDLWTPDKLELQLTALLNNSDVDAVYSWTVNMVDNDQSISFVRGSEPTVEGNIYPDLLLGNFIASGSNILIRRKVTDTIGGFEQLYVFEDWDFHLRIASKFRFAVVQKPQILYRQTYNSMSSNAKTMEQGGVIAVERAYSNAPEEFQYLKPKSFAFLYRYCAGLSLAQNVDADGLQYAQEKLWIAVKLYPKIIQEKYVQNLIIKLLIKRLLPKKTADSIIRVFKKILGRPDPRIT